MFFGTFVDRHLRRTSMLLSSAISLGAFALAGLVFAVAPAGAFQDLGSPAFWALVVLVLAGAIAGNLRAVALSTTVTLLVPEEGRDRANGLVGTANGVAFAITSVFSGLAIGLLGMGWCVVIAVVVTALVAVHLLTIRIEEGRPSPARTAPRVIDIGGAVRAVGLVPGPVRPAALLDVQQLPGRRVHVADRPLRADAGVRRGVGHRDGVHEPRLHRRRDRGRAARAGAQPLRTLLLANVVMWIVTITFPIRSEILPLAIGFFIYLTLVPVAEASEQTIIQKVVPVPRSRVASSGSRRASRRPPRRSRRSSSVPSPSSGSFRR